LFTESHAPSHILRKSPVPLALESPFHPIYFTVIPPPTALWKIGIRCTTLSHRFSVIICLKNKIVNTNEGGKVYNVTMIFKDKKGIGVWKKK